MGKAAETIDLIVRLHCWEDVVRHRRFFLGEIFRFFDNSGRYSISMRNKEGAIGIHHFGYFGVPEPESVSQPFPIVTVEPVDEFVQVFFAAWQAFPWSVVEEMLQSFDFGRIWPFFGLDGHAGKCWLHTASLVVEMVWPFSGASESILRMVDAPLDASVEDALQPFSLGGHVCSHSSRVIVVAIISPFFGVSGHVRS